MGRLKKGSFTPEELNALDLLERGWLLDKELLNELGVRNSNSFVTKCEYAGILLYEEHKSDIDRPGTTKSGVIYGMAERHKVLMPAYLSEGL